MRPIARTLIITAVALAIGNFVWAAAFGGHYDSAFERSFFQVVALGAAYWNLS